MSDKILKKLFQNHIEGTKAKEIVTNVEVLVCYLTSDVKMAGNFTSLKVYANTRMLKHLYDKKPAEEFYFILQNLDKIASHPDHLYRNLSSKRGDIGLLKKIDGEFYFCSLEKSSQKEKLKNSNHVSTCFRLRKKKKNNYLKNYKLFWSWKGDLPSS